MSLTPSPTDGSIRTERVRSWQVGFWRGGPSYREAKGGDVYPFWQARYYDFKVWSEEKRVEKLRYIHRNPVKRGLVERPEDWLWSSFHHYLTGEEGMVEIESHWTATRREKQGIYPTVRRRDTA